MTPLLAITLYLLVGVLFGSVVWALRLRRIRHDEREVHRRAVQTARHLPEFVLNVFLWPVMLPVRTIGGRRQDGQQEQAGR